MGAIYRALTSRAPTRRRRPVFRAPARGRPRHPEDPSAEDVGRDVVQVVVYTKGKKSVGLMVERILDIVEEALLVQSPGTRSGVMGNWNSRAPVAS